VEKKSTRISRESTSDYLPIGRKWERDIYDPIHGSRHDINLQPYGKEKREKFSSIGDLSYEGQKERLWLRQGVRGEARPTSRYQ